MNPVAKEILDIYYGRAPETDYDIEHYGIKRRSGRYPWGSGENPYQHSEDFLSRVEMMQKSGKSLAEIADEMDILNYKGEPSVTRLNDQIMIAKNQRRLLEVARAKSLREDGLSLSQIAKEMGYKNDSSIRSLLDPNAEARMMQLTVVADKLKEQCDKKGPIDVGTGTEIYLNVSKEKMRQSLEILRAQGYEVYGGGIKQVTNSNQQTNLKVLCPPGTESNIIYHPEKISFVDNIIMNETGTEFKKGFVYPESLDSDRIMIRYRDEGGNDKDGVVEIRRGVYDLSLGDSKYAQVRILVDGTHYIKGMAVYGDDMPDGVDVIFNTNKTPDKSKLEVLKPITDDPDNPFGALVKEHGGQYYYTDKDGNEKLGLINKTREEGDWDLWKDRLPSQFLSKQPKKLVETQLKKSLDDRKDEYEEIMKLNNPIVKKAFLDEFAASCDYQAVHLYSAALPRQKYQVILPLTSMKDTEVYAPGYQDGSQVALVRFPHGSTAEIPILTVNNKNPEGKKVLGNSSKDVVGINKNIADRLSGADFDGDTALVIPITDRVKIKNSPPLVGLVGFDPKLEYAERPGMTYMKYVDSDGKTHDNTQNEMGKISNLITDMTLLGASNEEITRAIRHSMVVIDAAKHKLDYKRSEMDNDIKSLKEEYQGGGGASTIISRAKGETRVTLRQGQPKVDKETGELVYKTADDDKRFYVNKKTGELVERTTKITQMEATNDAMTLVSEAQHPVELLYADFANSLKSMSNTARKESVTTPGLQYSRSAAKQYSEEVESLDEKLIEAKKNAPRERRAQIIATVNVETKLNETPALREDKGAVKKIRQQEITAARRSSGAERYSFEISDKEYEAIQAGAITSTKLQEIMRYADKDRLRELATPRNTGSLNAAKVSRIRTLEANGYTIDQIARAVGVSTSTVIEYLKKED